MWNLEECAGKTAIITGNGRYITYEKLDFMRKEFAGLMDERGSVFMIATDTVSMAAAYTGCVEQERQLLVSDENISEEKFKNFVMQYQPRYIYLPVRSSVAELAAWIGKENSLMIYAGDEYVLFQMNSNYGVLQSGDGIWEVSPDADRLRLRQMRKAENREHIIFSPSVCTEIRMEIMKYCISNGKTMILAESEPDSEIFWKIAEWYGADAILLEQIPEGKRIRERVEQNRKNIILLKENPLLSKLHKFVGGK
ncbi:MAG: hypothetical protein V8S39_12055 [Lachnospiraceae bacterium]